MKNSNTCWLQITAGQGPDECALAVGLVSKVIFKEARKSKIKFEVLDSVNINKKDAYNSMLLSLEGDDLDKFISKWNGVIQWICKSPYRPSHKRKNWYVGVNVLYPPEDLNFFDKSELRFETMRASGAGGQHVNTTDSSVRVTHIPTGLVARAQEERSQHQNKKLALARLADMFEIENDKSKTKKVKEAWMKHYQLERGNPIRVFVGLKMLEK